MIFRLLIILLLTASVVSGQRPASPVVYEKSYSYTRIPEKLRTLVNQNDKAAYFNDDFFNSTLRKILESREYDMREKVQLFYLLMQKIGYGFAGVAYIPPTHNYFKSHMGVVYLLEKMQKSLEGASLSSKDLLKIAKAESGKDDLLASNALLLCALAHPDSVVPELEKFTQPHTINASKLPAVVNHNVCLAASLVQNEKIVRNLELMLTALDKEAMLEDVLCALYSKPNPLGIIQKYILSENIPRNELVIQTALNALAFRLPEKSYKSSIKGLILATRIGWKKELLEKMHDGKIPFDYNLASAESLVTKVWDGFTVSHYLNGNLISIGDFMEFDPN